MSHEKNEIRKKKTKENVLVNTYVRLYRGILTWHVSASKPIPEKKTNFTEHFRDVSYRNGTVCCVHLLRVNWNLVRRTVSLGNCSLRICDRK